MAKKILVLSPSWIGDCVMTQPMLRRLSELHPDCVIDVFAPKWSQAVYRRMDEVNEILDNPFGHGALQLRERWRVGRMLGKRGYDQVIATAGSLKMGFLAFATGIKQRTGYVGEQRYGLLNDIRKLDKAALPLMVDRYTALAHESQAAFDGHSSPLMRQAKRRLWQRMGWIWTSPLSRFATARNTAWQSVGCRAILPQRRSITRSAVIRFGYLARTKILTWARRLTGFQAAFAPIYAAKRAWTKRLICSPAPTPCFATTAA